MLQKVLFQVHWFLGITAGVVLGIVGITGGVLSFEDELLGALNRDVMQVVPQAEAPLSPGKLLKALREANPGKRITALGFSSDARAAVRVTFQRAAGAGAGERGRRGDVRYADPYRGTLLGAAQRGEKFLQLTRQVHRYLAAGDVGKQIVGASTLALIFFCASGLYLRWPAKPLDWRAWLRPNFRLSGRKFLWQLHAFFATWALLFYLVAGLTGLYWSYGWYRDALISWSGAPRPTPPGDRTREGAEPAASEQSLDGAVLDESWRIFMRESGGFSSATVNLPSRPAQPMELRYLSPNPPHDRAFNNMRIDPQSGQVLRHDRFAARKPAARLVGAIFPLHSGSFFGAAGKVLMMVASFAMPLFPVTGWLMYLKRRARKRQAAATPVAYETPG